MLSVTDELCMHNFHFILLIIQVDSGRVLVVDSKRKEHEEWMDLIEMP